LQKPPVGGFFLPQPVLAAQEQLAMPNVMPGASSGGYVTPVSALPIHVGRMNVHAGSTERFVDQLAHRIVAGERDAMRAMREN
jgi:hypothetical protein